MEDIRENHSTNRVHFKLKVVDGYLAEWERKDEVYKKLKLTTSIPISNMVLFGADKKLKKYNTIKDILNVFYDLRLSFYDKRKDYLISKIQRDIQILDNKTKFILMVINDEIIIKRVKKKELIKVLLSKDFVPMNKMVKKKFLF